MRLSGEERNGRHPWIVYCDRDTHQKCYLYDIFAVVQFIEMGELDKVVGVTSTRHLFNREMNERLKSGKTAKIGIEGNFDNEVIMSMNPDLILVSPFKRGGYETLKDVGIPLIPHLGYKEMTPLGQAEWVKVRRPVGGTGAKGKRDIRRHRGPLQ